MGSLLKASWGLLMSSWGPPPFGAVRRASCAVLGLLFHATLSQATVTVLLLSIGHASGAAFWATEHSWRIATMPLGVYLHAKLGWASHVQKHKRAANISGPVPKP